MGADVSCISGCCKSQLTSGVSEALPIGVREGDIIVDVCCMDVSDGGKWTCVCCNVKGRPIACLRPKKKESSAEDFDTFKLSLGQLKPDIFALFFIATAKPNKTFNGKDFMGRISLNEGVTPAHPGSTSSGESYHICSCKRTSIGNGNTFVLLAVFRGSGSAFIHEGLKVFRGVPFEARWCAEAIGQSYHIFDSLDNPSSKLSSAMENLLPKLIQSLHSPTSHSRLDWHHCVGSAYSDAAVQVEWVPHNHRNVLFDEDDNEENKGFEGLGASNAEKLRILRSKARGPDEIL